MSEQNPYAPPQASVVGGVGTEVAPPLWNPTAAGAWSLLFSPIFGAFLHMQNWKALGQPDKAATSKQWLFGCIAFFVVLMVVSMFLPESGGMDAIARFGGLGLLIAWYYSIGKAQQTYVAERFGTNYPRRGWLLPIAAAFGVVVAIFAVAFVLTLVLIAAGVMSDAA